MLSAPLAIRDVPRLATTHGNLPQAKSNAENAVERRQGEWRP